MTRSRGGRVLGALLAVVLVIAGCTTGPTDKPGGDAKPTKTETSAVVPSSPAVSAPATQGAPGAAPNDIDTKALPTSFPPLLEETGVQAYLETMVRIHIGFTKNRQAHEVMPRIMAVKGGTECWLLPDRSGEPQVVGDDTSGTAGRPSPEIAPCYKGHVLHILYAPSKFYHLYRSNNVGFMHDVVRNLVRDYLSLLTQARLNNYDRLVVACAAGRMIGGLRDKQYITVQKANTLELSGEPTTEWDKVYVAARDTGNCPRKWMGWV